MTIESLDNWDHLRWNSYVSQAHHLLYVSTPKVACTSIKWWFASLEGVSDKILSCTDSSESDPELIIHDTFNKFAPHVTGLLPEQILEPLNSNEYFRFALVRNPYKRIFSAWQSKILLREPLQVGPYKNLEFFHLPIENTQDLIRAFEAFVEHIAKFEHPNFWDHHWATQTKLLRPDLISYSLISKIEDTKALGEALFKHLGTSYRDPFSLRSANESLIPYAPELFSEKARNLVREIYRADFESFDYPAELPQSKNALSPEEFQIALKATKLIRARNQRLGEIRSTLLNRVTDSEELVSSQKQTIDKLNLAVGELNSALLEKTSTHEQLIETLHSEILEKDVIHHQQIEKLHSEIIEIGAKHEAMIESIRSEHQRLQLSHTFKKQLLNECETTNGTLKSESEKLTLSSQAHESRASEVESYLQKILRSRSWRYTRPLRIIARKLPKFRSGKSDTRKELKVEHSNKTMGSIRKAIKAATYAKNHYGSYSLAAKKSIAIFKREGLAGIKERAYSLLLRNGHHTLEPISESTLPTYFTSSTEAPYQPLVTVIVPNYNHAKYLRKRLDSIYSQTYKNIEVLLLDDMSSDESHEILTEYQQQHKENTRCIFNEKNSGGVFHQWKRGLKLASGELIWIAESDDYCSDNFLEENIRNFRDEAVMLSFSRSAFVRDQDLTETWSTEEYLSELGAELWTQPFKKSAHWLVNNAWGQKNIIPNVSSAVFRNPGDMALFNSPEWYGMRVCGDWIFYLHLVRGGLVSYTTQATNYYRQHTNNTSVSAHAKDIYYQEHALVARHLIECYKLHDGVLTRLADDIQRQWKICRPDQPEDRINEVFDLDQIVKSASERKPNLVMAIYALAAGGGETFPIMLANLFKANGYCVSVLNCGEQPTEPGVRSMLRPDIPLLKLERLEYASAVFSDLGIEVVHSHHAWVDLTLAALLQGVPEVAHVVSMHGMYEMMTEHQLDSILPLMDRQISKIVYTAEKNLAPFSDDFMNRKGFTRIDNAIPDVPVNPIDRKELGISPGAFVLCLVSRGIPEKGWSEAIEAVTAAQSMTDREIHLIIIGEGDEYDRLAPNNAHENIHFLGFKSNIRDYYSASDMGFIPSRFKGESFPLVLIDCLQTGTPVLASNIGEIHYMLEADDGLAGALFDLEEWEIPVGCLSSMIANLATPSTGLYSNALSRVPAAARKFDPELLYSKYSAVYSSAIQQSSTCATSEENIQ